MEENVIFKDVDGVGTFALCTKKQYAELCCNGSVYAVTNMVKDGYLKGVKVGRKKLYPVRWFAKEKVWNDKTRLENQKVRVELFAREVDR